MTSTTPGRDEWPEIVRPELPHDALPFSDLAGRYNYGQTSDRRGVLVRLLVDELRRRPSPRTALDIGCGHGISDEMGKNAQYLAVIRAHADELWGVEPDKGVQPSHGLLTSFQHATMETASLPENHFDLAYSYFVMEHVERPADFLRAVHRCLKPGGSYVFMTVNGLHYFTRIAKLLKSIRLDEWVLRKMRGSAVDEYHYPVTYRCNKPRDIARAAADSGFAPPEFVYLEREGGPRTYFRGPTVALYHLLEMRRRLSHRPENLLELVCRLTKPAAP